jgi:hypothetical protein
MYPSLSRALRCGLLLAFLQSSGCVIVAAYPRVEPELGDAACHDGLDNDLDGVVDCNEEACWAVCHETCVVELPSGGVRVDDDHDGHVDCDDEDCFGQCPEDLLEACADGQDDDDDGLVDMADPGCWPFGDVELVSCSSVRGTAYDLDFDGTEIWAATTGSISPDPTGRFEGNSFVMTEDALGARATLETELTGAVAGTSVSLEVYLDVRLELSVRLEVADTPLEFAEAELRLAEGRIWSFVKYPDGSNFPTSTSAGFAAGHYRLELRFGADGNLVATIFFSDGSRFATATNTVAARGFRDAHRFRLQLEAHRPMGETGVVVVGGVTTRSGDLDPCGFSAPAGRPTHGSPQVLALAVDQDQVCGVGETNAYASGSDLTTWLVRSTDRGRTWRYASVAAGGIFSDGVVRDPAGGWRVAVARGAGGIGFGHTMDCETIEPVTEFIDLEGPFIGYRARGVQHEVVLLVNVDGVRHYFYERVADDGTVIERVDLGALPGFPRSENATLVGNDVIIAHEDDPASLSVVSFGPRTATSLREFAAFSTSGRAGACDEFDLQVPAVGVDATPVEVDPPAAATGLLVFDCNTSPIGLVTDRFIVRAP